LTLLSKLNLLTIRMSSPLSGGRDDMEPRAVAGDRGEFFYPICRNTPQAARPLGLKSVALALQREPGEFNLYLDVSVRKIGYPAPSPQCCRS